jgi:hypothetical protein
MECTDKHSYRMKKEHATNADVTKTKVEDP